MVTPYPLLLFGKKTQGLCAPPYYTKSDHFAKTGSGQT
jgi:hypothetical protein